MTIFSWNFNQIKNENEALDWEPQYSDDINVDQVLIDENITIANMHLQPMSNRNRSHLWQRQLHSSKASSIDLDDLDGGLHS